MRLTHFWSLMNDEFGSVRARALARDLTLSPLGSRTAEQALDDGEDPREVWLALCAATDVPAERLLGVTKPSGK